MSHANMTKDEIMKTLEELKQEAAAITAQKEGIITEIQKQMEIREQAKRSRDATNESGDKIAWGLAMDGIVQANKRISELEEEKQATREKGIAGQSKWPSIIKGIGPLEEKILREIETLKNDYKDLEGFRSQAQVVGAQFNLLIQEN